MYMRLYKKIYILYYYRNWFRGVCVCMGAPPIGDNKINRLFFRISVFCIVSTSDSSVYHQLYQCLRSKRGRVEIEWSHKKNRVHFGLTDGRGTMGRKGLRGLIIQIESSHFEGVHFFRSSFVFCFVAILYDFVRLSTFSWKTCWLIVACSAR